MPFRQQECKGGGGGPGHWEGQGGFLTALLWRLIPLVAGHQHLTSRATASAGPTALGCAWRRPLRPAGCEGAPGVSVLRSRSSTVVWGELHTGLSRGLGPLGKLRTNDFLTLVFNNPKRI